MLKNSYLRIFVIYTFLIFQILSVSNAYAFLGFDSNSNLLNQGGGDGFEPLDIPECRGNVDCQEYVVQRGNTLFSIANSYGVSTESIKIATNAAHNKMWNDGYSLLEIPYDKIENVSNITAGATLIIPVPTNGSSSSKEVVETTPSPEHSGSTTNEVEKFASEEEVAETPPSPGTSADPPRVYSIVTREKGLFNRSVDYISYIAREDNESIYSIAYDFGTEWWKIVFKNGLGNIKKGDEILIKLTDDVRNTISNNGNLQLANLDIESNSVNLTNENGSRIDSSDIVGGNAKGKVSDWWDGVKERASSMPRIIAMTAGGTAAAFAASVVAQYGGLGAYLIPITSVTGAQLIVLGVGLAGFALLVKAAVCTLNEDWCTFDW